MTRMHVLGLDVATKTGWAAFDGTTWRTGLLRCPIKRPPGAGLDAAHAGAVCDWYARELVELVTSAQPLHGIAIEEPLVIGKGTRINFQTAHMLHALAAEAARIAHRCGVPARYVNNGTWRRAFGVTGKGSDAKKASALRICRFEGISVGSDDEADAVGIARWLYGELAQRRFSRHGDAALFSGEMA